MTLITLISDEGFGVLASHIQLAGFLRAFAEAVSLSPVATFAPVALNASSDSVKISSISVHQW